MSSCSEILIENSFPYSSRKYFKTIINESFVHLLVKITFMSLFGLDTSESNMSQST